MNVPQMVKIFVASAMAFFIRVNPGLKWQRSEPEQPATVSSSLDIESHQPQRLQKELSTLLAPEQHLQWLNAVLGFCFSYVLGVSLQFVGTDVQFNHHHHHLPFSFVLLSFLVLLTFTFTLAAFFVHPNCTRTSQALEKIALLLVAAAFCHILSIPFSLELKFAFWAVFLLSLIILIIFKFFCHNTASS